MLGALLPADVMPTGPDIPLAAALVPPVAVAITPGAIFAGVICSFAHAANWNVATKPNAVARFMPPPINNLANNTLDSDALRSAQK